jgi:predicted nucleotidyltransferase component of viral defense system
MVAQSTPRVDFRELIDFIIENTDNSVQRSVLEKEVLHYDILNVLDSAGLLKELVFQGGTSLRLCRESNRLSEDLDFAGGPGFTSAKFEQIKACIEQSLNERYGLHIYVKQPSELSTEPDYENIKVSKWQISIETSPGTKNIPRQKIKIEIANVPAHTEELLPIRDNYPVFGAGRMPVLVRVETINEILADKVVAFPMSIKKIRHRDIWDIAWLLQQGASLEPNLVKVKLNDYKINDVYEPLLEQAIIKLPTIVDSKEFADQMRRFVKPSVISATLDKHGFTQYLLSENIKVFKSMLLALRPDQSSTDLPVNEFKM